MCVCEQQVFGFLNGPHGIFANVYTAIDEGLIADYRNMGGFDMIGSGCVLVHAVVAGGAGSCVAPVACADRVIAVCCCWWFCCVRRRHKIHTPEQFADSLTTCTKCVSRGVAWRLCCCLSHTCVHSVVMS